MSATPFVVRLVGPAGPDAQTEFAVAGPSAIVGRDQRCDVALPNDSSVSRRHARIEWSDHGFFRVVDLDSANGVWLEDRRISDERVEAGQRIRVGESILECRPGVPNQGLDVERTLLLDRRVELVAAAAQRQLSTAGQPVATSERQAMLLDDPTCVYYVTAGRLDVFIVTVEDGRALEGRTHFTTVEAGGGVLGFDPGQSSGSLFLAFGTAATAVRRITCAELDALVRQPHVSMQLAAVIDRWVMSATSRLTQELPPLPEPAVQLTAAVPSALESGQHARSALGVLWVPVETDGLRYLGSVALRPSRPAAYFPVTPHTSIELQPVDRRLMLEPRDTATLVASGQLWASLGLFHDALCACLAMATRRAVADESERLGIKAREAEAARDAAFDALGAVMGSTALADGSSGARTGRRESILDACRLVGRSRGIDVRASADVPVEQSFADHVAAIAAASGFRTRRVALRGDWWRTDAGALLGHTDDGSAVALLPRGPRAYTCVDTAAGSTQPVDATRASTLAPFAFTFYRPLPPGLLRVRDLVLFGVRGLGPDLWMLVGVGLLVGLVGAVIPLLTGQMIDRAIPQGEHGMLLQLGLGMLAVTLAMAALSIVQSVAVVRVETRMDEALQSGVWARLLTLPAGFFRRFGAGDLAQRAAGIHDIRLVVSSFGIRSILGLFSAVAYLALMLYLSPALAGVAVSITLVLVVCSAFGNYLLLRTQRQEVELRGQIASLVLQLIVGVAKVRLSNAEHHAFRVWAQRFAEQKRLSFALGRLQNVLGTLASGFQLLAPLAIFAAIYRFRAADPAGATTLTTGEFVAFYGAFGTFAAAMHDISNASLRLLVIVPFYERLQPILSAPPERDGTGAQPGRLRGEIATLRLHFRYRADGPWVLQDLTFSIRSGEFVALVGPSGCGKSTLLRLLLGFEQPTSGAVYYDGLDLSQLDARALRQQLGVVLQDSRLLPTDIFRNIVGDSSRTVNDAWEAAELAGLADDIRLMPMAMNTVVSEGGGTFSGGQRQRLLIARALAARPRVVFFDEATSALDNRAQAVVTRSLAGLQATRVVIAHRLSTLVDADRILYLDDGRIQEEGTYADLMAKGGLFAQLARRQIA